MGHLASKVSSECFITEALGLGSQPLKKALASSFVLSKGFTLFCHLYVTQIASQSFLGLNEDTHGSLLMIAVH